VRGSLQCMLHLFRGIVVAQLAGIARRATTRAPMEELQSATISVEAGVANDFRGRAKQRQVTVLSADVWRDVCAALDADLPWTTRRANLLVEGLSLPQHAGDTLEIGEVTLRIERETDPCSRMEEQQPGLKNALSPDWRGGVCCTVIRGGSIAIGDPVSIRAADAD